METKCPASPDKFPIVFVEATYGNIYSTLQIINDQNLKETLMI